MDRANLLDIFMPQLPLIEIFVRGTVMYLGLFLLIRLLIKREAGSLGMTDLLVIVLIADAAQNGMNGGYQSVTDGLLLVSTVLAWSYGLDVLAYRFPLCRRILRPAPVQLVKDGKLLERGLAKEKITEEEIIGEIRAHGFEDLDCVRAAYMESDGTISVITSIGARAEKRHRHKRGTTT